jgi:hypothetical protein
MQHNLRSQQQNRVRERKQGQGITRQTEIMKTGPVPQLDLGERTNHRKLHEHVHKE